MKYSSAQTERALRGDGDAGTRTSFAQAESAARLIETTRDFPAITVDTEDSTELILRAVAEGRPLTLTRSPEDTLRAAGGGRVGRSSDSVLLGLDRLNIGYFRLNRQGYVVEFNDRGSLLLGVDHSTPWPERHVANIPTLRETGLYEQLEVMVDGDRPFVSRRITTDTPGGNRVALNLCAMPGEGIDHDVVGIISEQIPESDELLRAREELRILAEVAAALSSSLELEDILRIILTGATASQGLGFNRAFLFLHDSDSNTLNGHMAVGPTSAEEAGQIWSRLDGMRLSLGQLLTGGAANSSGPHGPLAERIKGLTINLDDESLLADLCEAGKSCNLEEVGSVDTTTRELLERLGTRRVALVPLVSKGVCQGLIAADNYITDAAISDSAVRVLKVLSDQAAVAIQRARLHDAERDRTRQLEKTNRQLAQSQDQLVRSEKMSVMGAITAAVAEELRNPLKIMEGFVNLMRETGTWEDDRECTNILQSEICRAQDLLKQVIEFAAASEKHNQIFDCSAIVGTAIERLTSRAGDSRPEVYLSAATQRLPIHGNREQLGNALYQLLHLVVDEAGHFGALQMRTERVREQARIVITVACPVEARDNLNRTLGRLLERQTSALRLPVLVIGETLGYHGGSYRLTTAADGSPAITLELPLSMDKEVQS